MAPTIDGIRAAIMRGGTSKGVYVLADDLPTDPAARDELLLAIMGSPDPRQIDGIGGAHPLTSKVAVVGPSAPTDGPRRPTDVDYLFLQVGVDRALVSDRQNCGNLLAGVGPFAVWRGLVEAPGREVSVRIRLVNTASTATATFAVADGAPVETGTTAVSGVPGTGAPVRLDFHDLAGGSCGALLPTGRALDEIDAVPCTLVDNGMPVVVMTAPDLGVAGDESCAELEADTTLRARLESIRLAAGHLMGLGDVTETTVPKLTLVSAPRAGGDAGTRTFIPHRCHDAIGVLGAVSVATALRLPDAPVHQLLPDRVTERDTLVLEHPTGTFETAVRVRLGPDGSPVVERAGIVRTARLLMDGIVRPRPVAS